ncbi:ATP-binding protein [Paenibacillus chartarius]|uniref:histidine kinase n=1 Tax=Paenibacillus chartarius TaxID=747481 RepID=A0ABV6DQG8_9BACL
MFIFRTVVGKLWLTIIGLVAVVLLILGLFLNQYLTAYFAQSQDQADNLTSLADKLAAEASRHYDNDSFYELANDLLSFEDARMIVVTPAFEERSLTSPETAQEGLKTFRASDFFSQAQLQRVMQGEKLSISPTAEAGSLLHRESAYMAVAVPLIGATGSPLGAVVLYQSLRSIEDTQYYVMRLFAYVSLIGFLMTTFFAFFLFSRITRPLNQLNKAAELIARGEYGSRVPIMSTDEIGELARTFNRMGDQLLETIQALHHEKEHLSSVLGSMTDAVITLDADGRVILTNPQGERIVREWGAIQWLDKQDESENAEDSVLYIPEPLQPLFDLVVEDAREHVSKLNVRNGVWSIVLTPLYSWDGVRGAVAVLRDVTEEHRLDKLRKDFVANVSHELRTPLSMLQGYSEALIDDIAATPEERKELAQVIYDESLRMGRLVHDLLDLARMEAGHMEMNFREIDVAGLLKRIHRKFGALAKDRNVQLSLQIAEPSIILPHADEDRLEQVLTNLLDNALRHTPGGAAIHLRAKLERASGEKEVVLIEVADEGQGIPSEDVPYVFERFYKADKARTRGTSGGTGLGLAIVKNIVESHQGSVKVQSALGQGTTFSIRIPK